MSKLEHQQLSNDLYWTYYHYGKINRENTFHKIQWTGYNDANWWDRVSPKQRVRECECGKKFVIDFRANTLKERVWIIWSIEHQAWWKPNHAGYVVTRTEAGTYTFDEARDIVKGANIGEHNIPNEAMIEIEIDLGGAK